LGDVREINEVNSTKGGTSRFPNATESRFPNATEEGATEVGALLSFFKGRMGLEKSTGRVCVRKRAVVRRVRWVWRAETTWAGLHAPSGSGNSSSHAAASALTRE